MEQLSGTGTLDATPSSGALLANIMEAARGTPDQSTLAQGALVRILVAAAVPDGSIWYGPATAPRCLAQQPADQAPADAALPPIARAAYDRPGAIFDETDARVAVPLITRGEMLGVLVLEGATLLPHSLLQAIGEWLAGALQQIDLAEQIAQQKKHFQTIKRQQDELLSIISHDLKNPMASIKGYSDLLLRRSARNPDDPNRRGLQVISEQIMRMTGLLDQLLEVSRISNDRIRIQRQPADLARLTMQVVEEARGRTGRADLEIEADGTPLTGDFDADRIRQSIRNVLNNAINFSPEDSPVEVRIKHTPQEAILSIRDHGIGIPSDEIGRVFEPFFRASNARGRDGLGMGLFMTQQILAHHEGRIWFESTEGAGSTFYIALPLNPQPKPVYASRNSA